MKQSKMATCCNGSIWNGHKQGHPRVGDLVNMKGRQTCRVRRGVRLAMVDLNVDHPCGARISTGGFVVASTHGEKLAIVRDRRYRKRRVWREVDRQSRWEAPLPEEPVSRRHRR